MKILMTAILIDLPNRDSFKKVNANGVVFFSAPSISQPGMSARREAENAELLRKNWRANDLPNRERLTIQQKGQCLVLPFPVSLFFQIAQHAN